MKLIHTIKRTPTLMLLAMSTLVFAACGQQDLSSKEVRDPSTGSGGPADISYTFGTPTGFTVTAVDMGAQIFYKPNPTVDHYILYVGGDAELTEIDGIESPIDVGKANSIRILPDNNLAGETFFFAVKAVSPDGEEAPLTAAKSVTIEDLVGTEVGFDATLETCVQERSKFIFRNGKMELYYNESGSDTPGSDSDRCGINGTRLTLQRLNASGNASGPLYVFPAGNSGPWSADSVGDTLDIKIPDNDPDDGILPGPAVFVNMVASEPMTITKDGEFKKSCEGVSLSRVFGRVETDDAGTLNIVDFDARNCAQNNWFTFLEDGRDTEFNFKLYFQTTSP